jgi:hypothetical protein
LFTLVRLNTLAFTPSPFSFAEITPNPVKEIPKWAVDLAVTPPVEMRLICPVAALEVNELNPIPHTYAAPEAAVV